MRIFVTGPTGFAGAHLVEGLLLAGHEVFGLVHPATSHQPYPQAAAFHALPGDLLDGEALKQLLAEVEPEVIYHLAGQAYTNRSWQNPSLTLAVNTGGTLNILEAARSVGRPRVVMVTSADMYGGIRPNQLPITERTQPQPSHPYAVSKLAAAWLAPIYWQHYSLPVIEARPFNHLGPKQALGFVAPDFASQIAAIRLGQQAPVIRVGNLSAERDFTDVRDVVAAYQRLAEAGQPGQTYLVSSGRAIAIRAILDTLIELAGVNIDCVPDPDRLRPVETPRLFGSYAKIQRHVGWQPTIPLRETLQTVLDEWLARLQAPA